jgi:hypothetical protein
VTAQPEHRPDCPDHESCETCGADLCETCGVGEPATRCEAVPTLVHCDAFQCLCRECARAAGEDAKAEAYAEMRGMKF